MTRSRLLLGSALALALVACGSGGPSSEPTSTSSSDPGLKPLNDGITLSTSTPQRLAGIYADAAGDTHVLDEMLALPEMGQLPTLSRALGARGITGMDYPAVLALHKVAQQTAQTLKVNIPKLDPIAAEKGYCQAYPNAGSSCFGMCGPGCDCWSWVCGDCCYHWGCAVHDDWCNDGQWWWCYNITAVIALFGC